MNVVTTTTPPIPTLPRYQKMSQQNPFHTQSTHIVHPHRIGHYTHKSHDPTAPRVIREFATKQQRAVDDAITSHAHRQHWSGIRIPHPVPKGWSRHHSL